jgi:hypothetical protein
MAVIGITKAVCAWSHALFALEEQHEDYPH